MGGELLIVTGPPGAGKSTVAAALSELRSPSVLVEGDAFFGFLRAGRIDPWLAASDRQNELVTTVAGTAAGEFARGGFWTVYDGVLGPWFLPRFLAATGVSRVHYAVLLPSVEVCVERVATRVGHGFRDEAATRHMHEQFATSELPPAAVVSDDDAPAADLVERIAGLVASGRALLEA